MLDGSYYAGSGERPRTLLVEGCQQVLIRDLIIIEPQSWTLMLYSSQDVTIDNIKELSTGGGSDGIDIVGCRRVRVQNCMLRNGDDAVVIKSFAIPKYKELPNKNWQGVDDVEVRNCALQVHLGGQIFEIGHELSQGDIGNIRFIDCDVMGAHGQSGVFGIHNADGAVVSNVLYENIRVNHYYNKLVDIRVIQSRYGYSGEVGNVNDVIFRDIDVSVSKYNPGYSISLIGGYDAKHKVKNVRFENFKMNGKRVENADQLDLFTKQAEGITFR